MSSMHRSPHGSRVLAILAAILWIVALAAGPVVAASPSPPAAGPPFPEPVDGQAVYDYAGVLTPTTESQAESIIDAVEAQTKSEIVVYTQALGRTGVTTEETEAHAAALMDEWGVGRAGIDDGLVMLFDLDPSLQHGQVQLYRGSGFALSEAELQDIYDTKMLPLLENGDIDSAVLTALALVVNGTFGKPEPGGGSQGTTGVPPGPPFPDPETDRAVYDQAGLFSPETIVEAESTIDAIEARTGAEVVVYTQDSGEYDLTTEETEAKARALIDQWGIGRAGFDDGMVIFFDMDPSLEHGQVQLYAAPGFEAAYLTNAERQAIYENDMLPYLRSADFDDALTVALSKVDAAATPEHAASLQTARQVNAVVGLVGAPIVLFGLSGWAFVNWRRYGKDPVYLDDASVHIPAPPPDLTAASGAMVMDGGTSRRALTTAMLDLASRGLIAFREDSGGLFSSKKVGVDTSPEKGDAVVEAQRARNARRPIGPAEETALTSLRGLAVGEDGDFITPEDLPKFGSEVADFDKALEEHVVSRGWFAEKPSKVVGRWTGRGVLAIVAGVIALIAGLNIPLSGLTLIGIAAIVGGIVVVGFAQAMPAVTMPGAMIRAMLAAYRRTLQKTMAQARSMDQVVAEAGFDWLDTPDQAVVWGTALGLQGEIEGVLARSLEDVKQGQATGAVPYFPIWYQNSSGAPMMASAADAGSGGSLFSDSGIPDVGGMMSALGTIGNSPSSSGGGSGGGGFGGGGSGGGGGGAGGGF
jgi:uncharacterized membrane protein YgcG